MRDGVSVSLALDLNETADALNTDPFEQELTVGEFGGHAVAGDRYSVQYHGFAHSHIDGLTHFSHDGKLYNGVSVDVLEKPGNVDQHAAREDSVFRVLDAELPGAALGATAAPLSRDRPSF